MPADDPNLGNVAVTCKKCEGRVDQPLAWLRENRRFQCPHCDAPIDVDSDALESAAEDAMGRLSKLLGL